MSYKQLLLCLALALLGGCGAAGTGAPATPVAATTPNVAATPVTTPTTIATSAATAAATSTGGLGEAPLPNDALLSLRRSGGFAGIDETITIHSDGTVATVKLSGREEADSATTRHPGGAAAASELMQQIAATGLLDLPVANETAAVPCCDRILTTLSLDAAGQLRTYRTFDGDDTLEPALAETLQLIEAFVAASA